MARIDMSAVTFNGREVQSLRETFYQAIFATPALNQFHTLVSGIKAKQQIVFLGELGLTGKKIADCDVTPNASVIPASAKTWDPEYIGDRFEECFTDLLGTFWAWGLKNGVAKPDLTNTEFAIFLETRIGQAAQDAVLRHAWLGNKTASAYDATTNPTGTLTAGTDPVYFNAINGFWPQLTAIVAADAARRVTISQNAGANYGAQAFTATDITDGVATSYFESLVYSADMRLRGASDKVIIATQSLVDQYVRERKKVANSEIAYQRVENGISTVVIDGIEVVPFAFLDRMIRAYEDNGTKYNNPHRAVLTTKSNLQIGTEEEGNLSELDPFYDKTRKRYIVDYAFNLDAKVVENHMVQVAY